MAKNRNPEKYAPISTDKLAKYQDLWKNSTSREGVDPEVRAHLERVKTMGGGQGIEFLSNLNKDYLGAFMAPFSRNVEEADIAIVGLPFEKSAPMNASHKYGPKALRDLSKNSIRDEVRVAERDPVHEAHAIAEGVRTERLAVGSRVRAQPGSDSLVDVSKLGRPCGLCCRLAWIDERDRTCLP